MRDLDRAGRRAAEVVSDAAGADDRWRGHLHAGAAASRSCIFRPSARWCAASARARSATSARIAGNLATASPIGDTIPCLIALDASVTLASRAGTRTLPVGAFITGYRKTALRPGEIIAAIRIPLLAAGPEVRRLQAVQALRPGHLDRGRGLPPGARRRHRARTARGLWRHGGARDARRPISKPRSPAATGTTIAHADIDALLARDFTPMGDHRGGAAYRLRAAAGLVRRFQLETTSRVPTRVEAL